ncbi:MAG: LysR family transcriptional regulator [Spirochaetaceae bacterium]|jgi:DNA-binding transcriptional LysR family regulator|nr:LysR family transcriptional regulator [Spirochaetaceae bacterium]
MTIANLRLIKEIARAQSITQAANNLGIAQPHLSKMLRELERSVGFVIFDRSVRGVFPTSKGAVFLTYVDKILDQLKNIDGLAHTDTMDRFSVSIPRGSYIAEGFIKFVAENGYKEGMAFDISETNSVETINVLAEKRFNIGVVRYPISQEKYFLDYLAEKGLKHELIWEFEMLLLMSPQNPLAALSQITQDDLTRLVELTHGDNVIPYRSMTASKSFSVKKGDTLQRKVYIYDRGIQFSLLCSLPDTYMWVSPVPDNVLSTFHLIQRRCPHPENSYRDLLVFRKRYRFSDMDKNFVDCVYKLRNEVSQRTYQ